MSVIGRAFDAVRGETKEREAVLDALSSIGAPPPARAYKPKRRFVRDPLVKLMRKRGWSHKTPRDGLRRRLYCLASERWPWWDWGHPLMILTGSDFGGSWSEPEPPTWWYRRGAPTRMWRTGYPRHPFRSFQIVTDYDEFRRLTDGLDEDGMYEWNAINVNQDGDLHLGKRYWGGAFYDLPSEEVAILRKYLRMWRRLDWFGLRSWLYSQGLHAAVHRKRPFRCNTTPPRGSGGYSHWYCGEKRRHQGDHRFNNYTWAGGDARVEYIGDKP